MTSYRRLILNRCGCFKNTLITVTLKLFTW